MFGNMIKARRKDKPSPEKIVKLKLTNRNDYGII